MFDTVMSFTNTEEIEIVLQFLINMLNLFLFLHFPFGYFIVSLYFLCLCL